MPRSTKIGSPSSQPKALDVIAPGKTAPSTSSRPIIVTNRPMIKDPMAPATGVVRQSLPIEHSTGSTLLEPSDASRSMSSKPSPSSRGEAVSENTRAASSNGNALSAHAMAVSTTPTTADSISDTTATSDVPDSTEKIQSEPSAPQAVHDKELRAAYDAQEKVIVSRQYYLPISAMDTQRDVQRVVWLLLLVVIVGLVWIDLLLDANIVHLGPVHALTHIFTA